MKNEIQSNCICSPAIRIWSRGSICRVDQRKMFIILNFKTKRKSHIQIADLFLLWYIIIHNLFYFLNFSSFIIIITGKLKLDNHVTAQCSLREGYTHEYASIIFIDRMKYKDGNHWAQFFWKYSLWSLDSQLAYIPVSLSS